MSSSDAERPIDRNAASQTPKPINLTAAAESMSWIEACKSVGVSGASDEIGLEVRGLTHADEDRQNDGTRETVYVIVVGYGVLRSDDMEMECTGGDVLFVPRGCPHRFERLDGEIRIWRISPGSP